LHPDRLGQFAFGLATALSDDLGHARREERHEDHRDQPVANPDAKPSRLLDGIVTTIRRDFVWLAADFARHGGSPHPVGVSHLLLFLSVAGPGRNRR
jgi:hypothetical protein